MPQKPHIYQWEDEPISERPSQFASTSFALTSGYASAPPGLRRRAGRVGFRAMLTVAVALLALGGWLLHHYAHLVKQG